MLRRPNETTLPDDMQIQNIRTEDAALEHHIHALKALLAEPRPHDIDWCDQLVNMIEQVAEYGAQPGTPSRALSRALQASADEIQSLAMA